LEFKVLNNWELSNIDLGYDLTILTLNDNVDLRALVVIADKKKGFEKITLDKVADEYKDNMSDYLRGFKILDKKPVGILQHKGIEFSWNSALYRGFGFLWKCSNTKRIFILACMFKKDEEKKARTFRKTLRNSIRCHGKENKHYAFLDLDFYIPREFLFDEGMLLIGKNSLRFRKDNELLLLLKYSFGNTLLKKFYYDLAGWFDEFAIQDIKFKKEKLAEYKITKNGETIRGHNGYYFKGIKKIRKYALKVVTNYVLGYFWYCKSTNNIYVLLLKSQTENDFDMSEKEVFIQKTMKSVLCHKPKK
ncbi:MAG: hypothetical protein J7L47_00505, partial [Candidatus Odinarchaeota archaeon]|nr:hypothetical protein [Candidatus Odinarchaeota archaeon]